MKWHPPISYLRLCTYPPPTGPSHPTPWAIHPTEVRATRDFTCHFLRRHRTREATRPPDPIPLAGTPRLIFHPSVDLVAEARVTFSMITTTNLCWKSGAVERNEKWRRLRPWTVTSRPAAILRVWMARVVLEKLSGRGPHSNTTSFVSWSITFRLTKIPTVGSSKFCHKRLSSTKKYYRYVKNCRHIYAYLTT